MCAAVSAPYIGKDTAGSWTIRSAFHFEGRTARKNLGKTAWQLRRGVVASGYVRGDDELRRYEILQDFVGGGDIIYRLDKKKRIIGTRAKVTPVGRCDSGSLSDCGRRYDC